MRCVVALAAGVLLAGCASTAPCTLGISADVPVTVEQQAFFADLVINGGVAHGSGGYRVRHQPD